MQLKTSVRKEFWVRIVEKSEYGKGLWYGKGGLWHTRRKGLKDDVTSLSLHV